MQIHMGERTEQIHPVGGQNTYCCTIRNQETEFIFSHKTWTYVYVLCMALFYFIFILVSFTHKIRSSEPWPSCQSIKRIMIIQRNNLLSPFIIFLFISLTLLRLSVFLLLTSIAFLGFFNHDNSSCGTYFPKWISDNHSLLSASVDLCIQQ